MAKSRIMNYYTSKKSEIDFLFENEERKSKNSVSKAFSKSIRTKKDTATYNAHSYPTKVPPEGIVPFIQHYTNPGDVILDPFCGSGMTGVATRLFSIKTGEERSVVLNDLGTAATHISFNYNNPVDQVEFRKQSNLLVKELSEFKQEVYRTYHCLEGSQSDFLQLDLKVLQAESFEKAAFTVASGRKKFVVTTGEIVNAIWSEVNLCNACGNEINLWQAAMNSATGKMAKEFKCPKCKTVHTRSDFEKPHGHVLAYIIYEYTCPKTGRAKRFERAAAQFDVEISDAVGRKIKQNWYPDHPISPTREMMTMGPAKLGIKTVADFYTKRNLLVCSKIWDFISNIDCKRTRAALMFAATNSFWHATRMRRFNVKGGMRPLTGTLYVPQISAECNVFRVLEKKTDELAEFYSGDLFAKHGSEGRIESFQLNESATNLVSVPNNSIDYIFTDPPFGGNIYYSDCNVIWEGWLDHLTDDKNEILFNRSRKPKDGGKTRAQYHSLMDSAFSEMFRVLKPGKWASIVFNNSDNEVLSGFIDAAAKACFEVREVTFFDKDQKSVKGYMGQKGTQNVTNCDIVLTVQKPAKAKKVVAINRRGVSDDSLFKVIQGYLEKLPTRIASGDGTYTDEHRTSPFLHSMLIRHFIKNNLDLNELTIDRMHKVCSSFGMEYENGKWFLDSSKELAA